MPRDLSCNAACSRRISELTSGLPAAPKLQAKADQLLRCVKIGNATHANPISASRTGIKKTAWSKSCGSPKTEITNASAVVENEREERGIRPCPLDNPEHEQNEKEKRGQGQTPHHLKKKISHDLERIPCRERMFEKKRRRPCDQIRQRQQ